MRIGSANSNLRKKMDTGHKSCFPFIPLKVSHTSAFDLFVDMFSSLRVLEGYGVLNLSLSHLIPLTHYIPLFRTI